jgi:phosphoribosylanthranilate isomerase
MTRVKVCGITNASDAHAAVDAGADAIGFILYPRSPRYIEPGAAREIIAGLPPFVTAVGVFVDEDEATVKDAIALARFHAVQLHGSESPEYCERISAHAWVIKAARIKSAADLKALAAYRVTAFLLDAYVPGMPGGTGQVCDWSLAAGAGHLGPIILAGGLAPENVAEAVRCVRPYAVDVSSGVEAGPGRKDHEKLWAFIEAVRFS